MLGDPLALGDDDPALGALDDLVGGRTRILVSEPFHTRSAELLWRRYNRARARIYGMQVPAQDWLAPGKGC